MRSSLDAVMATHRSAQCGLCGGQLYHQGGCPADRETIVVEAMDALRWAYAGIPLYLICPCELGYPGVLACRHSLRRVKTSA